MSISTTKQERLTAGPFPLKSQIVTWFAPLVACIVCSRQQCAQSACKPTAGKKRIRKACLVLVPTRNCPEVFHDKDVILEE